MPRHSNGPRRSATCVPRSRKSPLSPQAATARSQRSTTPAMRSSVSAPTTSSPDAAAAASAVKSSQRHEKRFTRRIRPNPRSSERSTMRCSVGRRRPALSPVAGWRPSSRSWRRRHRWRARSSTGTGRRRSSSLRARPTSTCLQADRLGSRAVLRRGRRRVDIGLFGLPPAPTGDDGKCEGKGAAADVSVERGEPPAEDGEEPERRRERAPIGRRPRLEVVEGTGLGPVAPDDREGGALRSRQPSPTAIAARTREATSAAGTLVKP